MPSASAPLFVLLLVLASATGHAAAGDSHLTRGIQLYEYGDYAPAASSLERALTSGLSQGDRARARLYLASTWLAQGEEARARLVLEALFLESPTAQVDAALFPPALVSLADEVRNSPDGAPRPASPEPSNGQQPARAGLPKDAPAAAAGLVPSKKPDGAPPPLAFAFIPFGGGQFANGEPLKGSLFLATELLAYGIAAGALAKHESLKVEGSPGLFACSDARPCIFAPGDVRRAQRLQTTYVVAFWVGTTALVGGIVEALVDRP
jgi:hypothetical protein